MSLVSGDLLGTEDCLTMNIYSPVTSDDALLPVMVYIYGGGFITGSARLEEYGPDKWLDEQILVVTLNYRLYSLGFMSIGNTDNECRINRESIKIIINGFIITNEMNDSSLLSYIQCDDVTRYKSRSW